jgi:hypothetical protein
MSCLDALNLEETSKARVAVWLSCPFLIRGEP